MPKKTTRQGAFIYTPRLMLAIRGPSAAGKIDEKRALVALAPKLRRLSLARLPIAGIPGFLLVRTVEKHPLSTGASREAPVDNECFSTILTTSNLGIQAIGSWARLRYPGLGTLATSNPEIQALGSWATYLG